MGEERPLSARLEMTACTREPHIQSDRISVLRACNVRTITWVRLHPNCWWFLLVVRQYGGSLRFPSVPCVARIFPCWARHRAFSSVVERFVYTEDVGSSTLSTPTSFVCRLPPANPTGGFGFEENPLTFTILFARSRQTNPAREGFGSRILL